ncbi:chorismate-binding protein [Tenacibaculum sp. MEBiC06402]|uniref:chorismate-binding protein n=1 Tax=unclassified Tenacibaculum TaxID=2635139 RepID=UPI003B9CD8BA
MKIFNRVENALTEKLPFVIYKKPNSDFLQGFFQKDKEVNYSNNLDNDSGFVFAPFNDEKSPILFSGANSVVEKERINIEVNFPLDKISENNSQKDFHVHLVQKGVEAIQNNGFRKVVLSRKEEVILSSGLNEFEVFSRLLKKYPTAFVYFWYHPKVGKWMGATPETLISIKGKEFKTMSLAGTQVYQEGLDPNWSTKEIEEQYIVTDYISEKLQPICQELRIADLETIKIGNLLHLRTLVKGKVRGNISRLIKELHPTPAVCGLPKHSAKEFIMNEEGYDREFYTGFLGELNLDENSQVSNLYVNLRCMKLTSANAVNVYVGGGITSDSNPEKEWLETVAKSAAMKSVL